MPDLSQTPDFPAIQQLARALWRFGGGRGAAVLVGAGLSRTASLASGTVRLPPLWSDLAAEMAGRLYPNEIAAAPRDPLKLAEEYRVYFGQAALDELVLSLVADGTWSPSPTHHALLALPWSDVLTVNYDTLLERAAREAERAYEPVTMEMLGEWSYAAVEPDTEAAGAVSLVRAECVRLAEALRSRGLASTAIDHWRAAAADDPLPEVRFALDDPD